MEVQFDRARARAIHVHSWRRTSFWLQLTDSQSADLRKFAAASPDGHEKLTF